MLVFLTYCFGVLSMPASPAETGSAAANSRKAPLAAGPGASWPFSTSSSRDPFGQVAYPLSTRDEVKKSSETQSCACCSCTLDPPTYGSTDRIIHYPLAGVNIIWNIMLMVYDSVT